MRCIQCSFENIESARFCYKCGTSLSQASAAVQTTGATAAAPAATPLQATGQREKKKVGGWLGLFVFTCIVGNPAYILFQMVSTSNDAATQQVIIAFPNLKTINIVENFLLTALAVFSIYAGAMLLLVRPGAVSIAKAFLVSVIVFNIVDFGMIMLGGGLPAEATSELVRVLLGGYARSFIYCALWLAYLAKSQRVKELLS